MAMRLSVGSAPALAHLNELFTRSYYSAAGYVFESQPYALAADADVLDQLALLRREDRRHAQLIAGVLDDLDAVPLAGAFPYWYLDLNYLTVPTLAAFVVRALEDDLVRYDAALAALPADAVGAKATLQAIRLEKEAHLERMRPLAVAAQAREAADTKARIDARFSARSARLAKEKAAKEAAKKAAAKGPAKAAAPAASAASLDPKEPGISPKERARRTMLQKRGAAGGAPAPAAAPAAAAAATPAGGGLDPNEAGITPKEKARRQMLAKRGGGAPVAAAAAPAPAAASAPAADDLPDPDEPGIPPKEKARRQMLKKRAAAGGGAPAAASAPAPAAAAAPAALPAPAAPAAPVEEDLDPDEPGLSPKEKARRTMLRKRRGA